MFGPQARSEAVHTNDAAMGSVTLVLEVNTRACHAPAMKHPWVNRRRGISFCSRKSFLESALLRAMGTLMLVNITTVESRKASDASEK